MFCFLLRINVKILCFSFAGHKRKGVDKIVSFACSAIAFDSLSCMKMNTCLSLGKEMLFYGIVFMFFFLLFLFFFFIFLSSCFFFLFKFLLSLSFRQCL